MSAGYGLLDIGLRKLDENRGWTKPFRNARDIGRAAVFFGSLAANMTGYETDYSEVLAYSSMPGLLDSAYQALEQQFSARTAAVAPVAVPAPAPAAPAARVH